MAVITISRGSYSGGKAVAEQLGARLNHPVFSREQALLQAAEQYGISERELTETLNQPPPFWQQVLGKRLAYVKCVTAVLLDHVRQGGLVYHGNVGHLLLAGVPHVLRVRVIAGLEQRITAAMAQSGLNREQAIAHIQRVDHERSKWAQVLYGVDWNDPGQYDVILNLEHLSAESACETIARMTGLKEFQPSPRKPSTSRGRQPEFKGVGRDGEQPAHAQRRSGSHRPRRQRDHHRQCRLHQGG
ncbi:MAG: cytidylate kinase family protein [Verrucomicrobia bacterium]|nr:cytidylate kinase family protein [Verrucomicrobiota bacterium]